jgi:hypothetical protein
MIILGKVRPLSRHLTEAHPQVSIIARRSIDTIRYWERLGQLPPSAKIGRRRVWKRAQIEQHFGSMFAA